MILFNMGVSVHFQQAESETGRELRSAAELWYMFSQPIHPSNVWIAAYEGDRRFIEEWLIGFAWLAKQDSVGKDGFRERGP